MNPLALASRCGRTLIALLAVYAAILSTFCWIGSGRDVTNEMRAAPTLAVVHGVSIFQTGRENVSFSVLYGPLSYLFHVPATLFRGPRAFFLTGCLLSFVFYCAPLLIFLWSLRRRRGHISTALLFWTLFALVTLSSRSLTLSSMLFSPDAAALGFSGAACAVLFFYSDQHAWRDPALIAAFICCAVFSKQNMLAVAAVLPLFALQIGGRRLALRLLLSLAICAAISVAAIFFVYHDLPAVYFNNIVIPSRFPRQWDHLPHAVRLLYAESSLLLLVLGFLLLSFRIARRNAPGVSRKDFCRALLFPCMAAALVPPSLLGMVFWGGWLNALSPAIYFLLLTLLAFAWLLMVEIQSTSNVRFLVAGGLVVFAAVLSPLVLDKVDRSALHTPSSSELAYRYELGHPGQVYFPFNQVSVFLAAHAFYHADWGIMNFYHGGFPFSGAEIRKHVPPAARFVAYPPGAPTIAPLAAELAPNSRRVDLAGLPGFNIVELEPVNRAAR